MRPAGAPLRIALVAHVVDFHDGQGRVNYEIAQAALHQGMHVTLITESCAAYFSTHQQARIVLLPTGKLPTRFLKNLSFAVRSAQWLGRNRHEIDVIQANGFITFAAADIVAAHFVHRAWLHSAYARRHGWSLYALYQRAYTRLNAQLEQTAFRRARRIVAVSTNVARELQSAGALPGKIVTIFNGVDLDEFYPRPSHRSLFQLPEAVTLFLFSGDIRTNRKNLDGVLRALAQVTSVHLAVAGVLAGSPYPALARELGIADRVHFLGYISRMSALMTSADVFVFPSRYDPLGLVVLEAMASGIPVITASTTGASALLNHPQWTLRDPEDQAGLIRMMDLLARDPSLRESLGHANREQALQFSWATMARSYLDLYRRVLDEKTSEARFIDQGAA